MAYGGSKWRIGEGMGSQVSSHQTSIQPKPIQPRPTGGVVDFYNQFEQTIDAKGRLVLPAPDRIELVDVTGDGTEVGACASSTPAIGGLIKRDELQAGLIQHVLKMSAPDSLLKVGPVWPARTQDGNASTAYIGDIPMGTMWALPPDIDVDALATSAEGRAIGHALQDFGGYVLVRALRCCLFAEGSNVDKEAINRGIADYKVFLRYLVAVDGSTAQHPGGGGQLQD